MTDPAKFMEIISVVVVGILGIGYGIIKFIGVKPKKIILLKFIQKYMNFLQNSEL